MKAYDEWLNKRENFNDNIYVYILFFEANI
jgi:hypothetical protein